MSVWPWYDVSIKLSSIRCLPPGCHGLARHSSDWAELQLQRPPGICCDSRWMKNKQRMGKLDPGSDSQARVIILCQTCQQQFPHGWLQATCDVDSRSEAALMMDSGTNQWLQSTDDWPQTLYQICQPLISMWITRTRRMGPPKRLKVSSEWGI